MEIGSAMEEENRLSSLAFQIITVAVCGNKSSKHALKWALDKFIPEGRLIFKLLYVRPTIATVPTPMGISIPILKVRDDIAAAYKKEIEWQTDAMLLPFKNLCNKRQVEAKAIVIEADDVAEAISSVVSKYLFTTLVIGASSRNLLTRKFKGREMSSRISDCAPNFCTVYTVSNDRLSSVRHSTSDIILNRDEKTVRHSTSDIILNRDEKTDCRMSVSSDASRTSSSQAASEGTSPNSSTEYSYNCPSSLPLQRYQALLTVNQALMNRKANMVDVHRSKQSLCPSEEDDMTSISDYSEMPYGGSLISSSRSIETDDYSIVSDQPSSSNRLAEASMSGSEMDLNFELERLRLELKHLNGIHTMAQTEKMEASIQLDDLSKRRTVEAIALREINLREEQARELAELQKERNEVARREAELVRECAWREALDKEKAEIQAARDKKGRLKLEKSLMNIDQKYKRFSWEEIESATSSFSDTNKIGIGAYGTVYKCKLAHTIVAVKVLHSFEGQIKRTFQQELDILSSIHHPHLLLLLGACPEHGCVVYEYMDNGSLEDRLFRKDNTPSIPWFHRFRIAWEIAAALAFLHDAKPKQIVHRDLKPSNILLDQKLFSKIGDVGLSTLLPSDNSSVASIYKETAPIGTLCYIDPEYQRSGLVSPKSDLYAFGIVVMQLLTAKPPMALAPIVETALEEGNLAGILDADAGQWPLEETQELALLALSCTELRGRDRPDLSSQLLPNLKRLKDFAEMANDSSTPVPAAPPSHFICPILKDVMNDPCVAADGYTYDRTAMEIWLNMNDKSPVTNSTLPHKHLIPNYTLLSAITEWRTRNRS